MTFSMNQVWPVIFCNQKLGFCTHCLSVADYLAVVRKLFWQLGQIVVAVAFVESWPL